MSLPAPRVSDASAAYLRAAARAFAGAVIFSTPLLMTAEMWTLALSMDTLQMLVFVLMSLPVLVGLSHYGGFEGTFDLAEDVLDALTAFAIGTLASAVLLSVLGILRPDMDLATLARTIAIQSVPAAIGAMVARKQLGEPEPDESRERQHVGYFGTLFLMGVGALYFAFNVAPTEEVVLVAHSMTPWHGIVLLLVSLLLMHALVYVIGLAGQHPHEHGIVETFYRYTLVGYAVALGMSLFVLWIFGRTEGVSGEQLARAAVVLSFPSALGAATARLIL